jgi:phosphatidylinositol alpha 1,6-mannosyltransferase
MSDLRAVAPRAAFLGMQGGLDLARSMASLDLFVHTGAHETFCQAAHEALASGVPVVQPRRGAFPEIVSNTGGGIVVEPNDPDALAAAYLDLWRNPDKAAALGRAGADGVREHYDVGRMAEAAENAYRSVMTGV